MSETYFGTYFKALPCFIHLVMNRRYYSGCLFLLWVQVLSSPKTCAFGGRVAGSWTRRLAARASQQLLRRHLGRLECRVPKPFEEDQFFKNLYFALPIAVRTALRPMHTIQSARMNALTIFTGRSCVSSDTSDAATSLIQCSKNFR